MCKGEVERRVSCVGNTETNIARAWFGSYVGKQQHLLSVWKLLWVARELTTIKSVYIYLCMSPQLQS